MQETTYTCDRCRVSEKELGTEQNQIDLYNLEVIAKAAKSGARYTGFLKAQWCGKCIAKTGASSMTDEIRAKILQQEEVNSKRITLEDLIYEMVEDACSNH